MAKKIISIMLVAAMLFTSLPTLAIADGFDPNAGGGGGTGGIGAGTWNTSMQGLRVSLLSGGEPFPLLGSNSVVDLWYDAAPPAGSSQLMGGINRLGEEAYGTCSHYIRHEADIADLPYPITVSYTAEGEMVFVSNGEAIKQYLCSGDVTVDYTGVGTEIGGFYGSSSTTNPSKDVTVADMVYSSTTDEEKDAAINRLITVDIKYLNSVYKNEYNILCRSKASALSPADLKKKIETVVQELGSEADRYNLNDLQMLRYSKKMAEAKANIISKIDSEYTTQYDSGAATTNALGDYKELQNFEVADELVPLAEGANDGGKKITEFLKAAYADVIDGESLAAAINADPNVKVLVEAMVYYIPVNRDASMKFSSVCYGTALNWAEFNSRNAAELGNAIGGGMAKLSNSGLPRSMVTVESDVELEINPPSDSGVQYISTDELSKREVGWGTHIYTKTESSGTRTWDTKTYPDGTPGPAPKSIPDNASTSEEELLKQTLKATIVKFYENNDGPEKNFVRENVPSTIFIDDEPIYSLVDWFISPNKKLPSSASTSYDDTKASCSISETGAISTTVSVIEPNTTLYVKLKKKDLAETILQEFRLNESELTKAFNNRTVYGQAGWDNTHVWTWSAPAIERIGERWDFCKLTDSSLKFYVKLKSLIAEAVATVTPFKAEDSNGVKATRGTYGEHSVDIANLLHFVVYRFKDKPTMAKFRMSASDPIIKLFPSYANKPVGVGRDNTESSYMSEITMQVDGDTGKSDTYTKAKWRLYHPPTERRGSYYTYDYPSSYHNTTDFTFKGYLQTLIYHRLPSKTKVGKNSGTFCEGFEMPTLFNGLYTEHTEGVFVPTSPIKFYPYVRMSYQKAGEYGTKQNAYVLSEGQSIIHPLDHVEAGWITLNEEQSLNLTSQQWSTWARANQQTDDGDIEVVRPWAGPNQVLPGGAIYYLQTEGTTSIANVGTWQTVVPDVKSNGSSVSLRDLLEEQGTNFGSGSKDSYTVDSAVKEHLSLAETAEHALDTLRITQWVNQDPMANKAWEGPNKVEVFSTANGISLGALGLPNRTRTDSKYYLEPDYAGDSPNPNEGDIDIAEKRTQAAVYKLSSDTSGNIYFNMCTSKYYTGELVVPESEIERCIDKIAGDRGTRILSKNQWVSKLKSSNSDAYELEVKTHAVSNLLDSIERGTGDDNTAAWASDGAWYNEAMDGIYVVRIITSYKLGIVSDPERMSVLDPNLCPKSEGVRDLFTKAHLSQFRLCDESDAYIGRGYGYVGQFKGQDVTMPDMPLILQSKRFYIPNATVQDLTGSAY